LTTKPDEEPASPDQWSTSPDYTAKQLLTLLSADEKVSYINECPFCHTLEAQQFFQQFHYDQTLN